MSVAIDSRRERSVPRRTDSVELEQVGRNKTLVL